MLAYSLNNRLIVETYAKEGLRSDVSGGFARISQKNTSKGLKVLVDARMNDGFVIPKGSIAYIREEVLHNSAWATKPLESEHVGQPYLIVEMAYVDYVALPNFEISTGENR